MLSSGAGYDCGSLRAAIASVTMPFCWPRQRELAAVSMQSTWGPVLARRVSRLRRV
jgi:hypothetical protein